MSLTSDALAIEVQTASKLLDLVVSLLDKQGVTEQERDAAKKQAADLISADQTDASSVSDLTAKFQAVLDKAAGATPAPAAPTAPVPTPSGSTVAPGAVTSSTGEAPVPAPTGNVAAPTVSNSNDGTSSTPVVSTNPVGDTSATTTAK